MFPDSCVDDAAVEEDLGCIGDAVEHPEGLIELLTVIVHQRLHPGLNFLRPSVLYYEKPEGHTCFNDMFN